MLRIDPDKKNEKAEDKEKDPKDPVLEVSPEFKEYLEDAFQALWPKAKG